MMTNPCPQSEIAIIALSKDQSLCEISNYCKRYTNVKLLQQDKLHIVRYYSSVTQPNDASLTFLMYL